MIFLGIAFSILLIFSIYLFATIKQKIVDNKKKKIKSKDALLRAYLKNLNSTDNEKLSITDETPKEVFIGNRFYLLQPLKYRQYTRLCVLLARSMQTAQSKGIDLTNVTDNIGSVIEHMEDDFFRAVAIVLYFSRERDEKNEVKIFEGMNKEYEYLVEHATIDEISRTLEVIMSQNDIARALKSFSLISGKKKPIMGI